MRCEIELGLRVHRSMGLVINENKNSSNRGGEMVHERERDPTKM